jgi:hypothetical protein
MFRFGSIGRETLVVVSVGGLMAAAALLPRVVGEPSGQHFALPHLPAAKSANVTAPIFAPPPPRVIKHRPQVVLHLVPRAVSVSVATAPVVPHVPTRAAVSAAHPSEASPRPATRQPRHAVQRQRVLSTPAASVAPPQPVSPPAAVPQPTPTPSSDRPANPRTADSHPADADRVAHHRRRRLDSAHRLGTADRRADSRGRRAVDEARRIGKEPRQGRPEAGAEIGGCAGRNAAAGTRKGAQGRRSGGADRRERRNAGGANGALAPATCARRRERHLVPVGCRHPGSRLPTCTRQGAQARPRRAADRPRAAAANRARPAAAASTTSGTERAATARPGAAVRAIAGPAFARPGPPRARRRLGRLARARKAEVALTRC